MNDDRQLRQWLGGHRAEVAASVRATGASPSDHPDVDTLARHATSQLSAGKARLVSQHLLVCEDGRCVAFVRANVEDVDAAASLLYPGDEAREMHARTFLCREALWEAFEDMAREQGAPVDDLLAEAMRSYARQRSYGGATGEEPRASDPLPHDYQAEDAPDLARTNAIRQPTQRLNAPTAEAPAMRRPMGGGLGAPNPRPVANIPTARGVAPPHSSPPPRAPAPLPEPPGRIPLQRPFTQPINQQLPAPPPRGGAQRFPNVAAPLPPPPPGRMSPPTNSRSMPPPLPPSDPYMGAAPPYAQGRGRPQAAPDALSLTYDNRTMDVTKDRFILGRSKTQADLVLDDANVSRQHAAIERVGDTWFLADLGSTNGCYVEGQRVSRRQIADGDVIEITTHQIRCTLR
jgi:hypothetical protein